MEDWKGLKAPLRLRSNPKTGLNKSNSSLTKFKIIPGISTLKANDSLWKT